MVVFSIGYHQMWLFFCSCLDFVCMIFFWIESFVGCLYFFCLFLHVLYMLFLFSLGKEEEIGSKHANSKR